MEQLTARKTDIVLESKHTHAHRHIHKNRKMNKLQDIQTNLQSQGIVHLQLKHFSGKGHELKTYFQQHKDDMKINQRQKNTDQQHNTRTERGKIHTTSVV